MRDGSGIGSPLSTEAERAPGAAWDRWVQAADADLPSTWDLTISVVSPEGAVVETTTTSGSGDGDVYAVSGNGKGTQKASAQVQSQQIPLL